MLEKLTQIGGENTPVFIATYNDKPIGLAILAKRYHYDWLQAYVSPKYRRRGIGSRLVLEVKRYKNRSNFYCSGWNVPAAQFFRKNIRPFKSSYMYY